MEKLAYLLWAPNGDTDALGARLRDETALALAAAGARYVSVSVADREVAAGGGLRIGSMEPPKDALITFWLDASASRAAAEAAIESAAARIAGYLVCESRPLVTPGEYVGGTGDRTAGFHLVTCISARPDLAYGQFVERWHGEFADVAIGTQSTWDYVRNEIVRPLTDGAPAWNAIVEEGFPIEALDDPAAFFDAAGDEALLAERQQEMFEAVQGFLDLNSVESHPMSQYVFETGPGGSR